MKNIFKNSLLVLVFSFVSLHFAIAFAQENSALESARQLKKQEIIDLISNKAVSYRITVGLVGGNSLNVPMMKTTFTKTEESGGTLVAFAPRSSSEGKWHVDDNSQLVRQYDKVSWGNKPFAVGVFETNGKYYWKISGVFQELVSIE